MANNRLYLADDETGDTCLLAKSFGDGWELVVDAVNLAAWLKARGDYNATCGGTSSGTSLRLLTEHGGPEEADAFCERHKNA